MFNNRARALKVGLVLAAIGFVAVIFITRGAAVTTQTAPNALIVQVNPGTTSSPVTLPLKTPVSISISDIGPAAAGPSNGTGSITACAGGTSWSWIGLTGTGALAKGNSVGAVGALMTFTFTTSQRVILNSASTIKIVNASATYVRAYIHW